MDYPFNKNENYFSPAEMKHLQKFLSAEPQENTIYENADGKKRTVLRVILPRGVETIDTVYLRLTDGNTFYHTPRAKGEGSEASIIYEDDTGKQYNVKSKEWVSWVDDDANISLRPKPEIPSWIEARRKMMKAQHTASVDGKEEFDKETKKEFTSTRNKKKK